MMQQKRNPEASIRVVRWKRASERLVGGHGRSMGCFEVWLQVKESAGGGGENTGTQKVLTESSGNGRSESVNMMKRGSQGSCLGSLRHSGRCFFLERKTKTADSSREGLPQVSEDKGKLRSWHGTARHGTPI